MSILVVCVPLAAKHSVTSFFYLMYSLSLRISDIVILVTIHDAVIFHKKCNARWFILRILEKRLNWFGSFFMHVNIFGSIRMMVVCAYGKQMLFHPTSHQSEQCLLDYIPSWHSPILVSSVCILGAWNWVLWSILEKGLIMFILTAMNMHITLFYCNEKMFF
jgi:hypothetical protein